MQQSLFDDLSAPAPTISLADLMNENVPYEKVEASLEEYLKVELAQFELLAVEAVAEKDPSVKYKYSSALQKSIRRGYVQDSIRYALTYHSVDPTGFWTRLVVIAFEDLGIGDVLTVALTLAAARSKTIRQKIGGDVKIIHYIVKAMAETVKDRTVCDLMQVHWNSPKKPEELDCLRKASLNDLSAMMLAETNTSDLKISAAWLLAGSDKYENKKLPLRTGSREQFNSTIERMKIPALVKYITQRGMVACRYPMNLVYPFTWELLHKSPYSKVIETTFPADRFYIGGLPEEAFDQHTRDGKSSMLYFYKACDPVNEWLTSRSIVGVDEIQAAIGAAVFISEGALLDKKIDFDGAGEIFDTTERNDYAKSGLTLDDGRALAKLIADNFEALRRSRIRVVSGKKV
jgi:hypothetical protein